MSGYNRPCNSFAGGKSDSRIKRTNVDSGMQSKPKGKIATERSSDSDHCCQKDHSSVSGKEFVKDEGSSTENRKKPMPILPEDDDTSKKEKQIGDKLQKDDGNDSASLKSGFDICPKGVGSGVKLKAPIHLINREKRNQMKRSLEGPKFVTLRPGMVLMKGYISLDDQISIVKTCRDLGIGNGGFYQPGYSGGTKLHLKMMCLGKNWDPESHLYSELRPFDKSKPSGIPDKFHDMVKKAIQDANEHMGGNIASAKEGKIIPSISPDICIVNFYTKTGKLGLHQDKDETENSLKDGLPVVSFSIGYSAEFLYGDTRDIDEAKRVTLESGDVLIFSGKSRLIFHGVTGVNSDATPASLIDATNMLPGRLNLTFRKY